MASLQNFLQTHNIQHLSSLRGSNGLIFTSSEKATLFANLMENQFILNPDSYSKETITIVNRALQNLNIPTLFLNAELVAPPEVQRFAKKLRSKSAGGLDGIPATAIKETSRKLFVLLCKIFNSLLRFGHFPLV